MTITAIPTNYAGCRFRSRLEARWAVFFDALGIDWQYEPQGFMVDTRPYLPDFYLPASQTWVEVKGDEQSFRDHAGLYAAALDYGGCLPGVGDSDGSTRGLLVLGPVPKHRDGYLPAHALLQHREGVLTNWGFFTSGGLAYYPGAGDCRTMELPELGSYTAPGYLSLASQGASRNAFSRPARAYTAARSARFEHGERP